jgi:purine-binding chemotaxis protein CheW
MDEATRFLILSLAGENYAVRITGLLEITVPRNIQKDPKLSEIFEGKIDYRGRSIPVVNLKKILKIPGGPGAALLVMQSGRGVIGLLADAVSEILDTARAPAPLPRGVVNQRLGYYAGVLRGSRQDLVLLLNVDGLFP